VWLVKGKAVEDSQDARQEVLLPAYRVTGKQEVIGDCCDLKDKWFLDVYNSIFNFKADARRTSALVTEWSQ